MGIGSLKNLLEIFKKTWKEKLKGFWEALTYKLRLKASA